MTINRLLVTALSITGARVKEPPPPLIRYKYIYVLIADERRGVSLTQVPVSSIVTPGCHNQCQK